MLVTWDLELVVTLALVSYSAFWMWVRTRPHRTCAVLFPLRIKSMGGDLSQYYLKADVGSQGM